MARHSHQPIKSSVDFAAFDGSIRWNDDRPLLSLEPAINFPLQDRQRKRAIAKNDVMKLANIKLGPELLLGPGPQLLNLQLPNLIGERLGGNGNVTVHLA